ncbi:hypothetical protein [Streptomyces triticagri]|uniref:hypothetical protein n=1 Tax=Streptomyces triticagri TaxID=2293568 RepID=UPI0013149810|nr:hypothetical protein [Streptomyces triticagri]
MSHAPYQPPTSGPHFGPPAMPPPRMYRTTIAKIVAATHTALLDNGHLQIGK